MAAKSFRIREYDDADNVVATYVQSLGSEKESRVDVIVCSLYTLRNAGEANGDVATWKCCVHHLAMEQDA